MQKASTLFDGSEITFFNRRPLASRHRKNLLIPVFLPGIKGFSRKYAVLKKNEKFKNTIELFLDVKIGCLVKVER
jgi:hypothetical protein